jgi:hypothetical protein
MPEEEAWPLGGKVKYSKEVHIMPQQLRRNMKAKDCKNKVSHGVNVLIICTEILKIRVLKI